MSKYLTDSDELARAVGSNRYVGMRLERRPTDGGYVVLIFDDETAVEVGDNAAALSLIIPNDNHHCRLSDVSAAVTTVGGGVTVQIRNVTNGNVDMLATPITIDAGELTSFTAATPAVVDETVQAVDRGDRIVFDVDAAGGELGLIVKLLFE